jgi:hypothetical protein
MRLASNAGVVPFESIMRKTFLSTPGMLDLRDVSGTARTTPGAGPTGKPGCRLRWPGSPVDGAHHIHPQEPVLVGTNGAAI